ncbi:hypothetical protein MMC17_002247 [Xylographa soralifera]|nr:hypothetical protein [Xylographa soralifera]
MSGIMLRSVLHRNACVTTVNSRDTSQMGARILELQKRDEAKQSELSLVDVAIPVVNRVILLSRACPNAGLQAGAGLGRGGMPPRGGFGGGFRGGFAGGPRPATCYKCGGPNHYARDCQAQAMKCYACGKLGHISRDCTAPNGGPLNAAGKVCYKCGQAGHISRDCTTPEMNGQPGIEAVDGLVQTQPTITPTAVA